MSPLWIITLNRFRVLAVFSRGDPYFGEDVTTVVNAVKDPHRNPEYRPTIELVQGFPDKAEVVMKVRPQFFTI
jgi:hypothetical protein